MNRDHDGYMSKRGIDLVRRSFLGRTSIDLIFGWPNQSVKEWEQELNIALAHADDHISMYQLTWERGTKSGFMLLFIITHEPLTVCLDCIAKSSERTLMKIELQICIYWGMRCYAMLDLFDMKYLHFIAIRVALYTIYWLGMDMII
jgi:hypothetical protein